MAYNCLTWKKCEDTCICSYKGQLMHYISSLLTKTTHRVNSWVTLHKKKSEKYHVIYMEYKCIGQTYRWKKILNCSILSRDDFLKLTSIVCKGKCSLPVYFSISSFFIVVCKVKCSLPVYSSICVVFTEFQSISRISKYF